MLHAPLQIGRHTFESRLFVGTGKYRDVDETRRALDASGAEVVTVALRRVNRDFLGHDYDTDVLSFLFESHCVARDTYRGTRRRAHGRAIDGEVLVSGEMAAQRAPRFGWSAREELTLYLVHGLLHLCEYDDQTPRERRVMREREQAILAELGIAGPAAVRRGRSVRGAGATKGYVS